MKVKLNKVYRAKNGQEFKIFCAVMGDEGQITYISTNKNQNEMLRFYEDGLCKDYYGEEYDLIKLVGDEFSEIGVKKLREFKFKGYLQEFKSKADNTNCIENVLGHDVTHLYTSIDSLRDDYPISQFLGCENISKWEITMKELNRGEEK